MGSSTGGMYPADILNRRHDAFVLWVPHSSSNQPNAPHLVIGTSGENANDFNQVARVPLSLSDKPDLWSLDPKTINPRLTDPGVYHYWFEITDTSPERRGTMLVTDPLAFTVDYNVTQQNTNFYERQPASIIKYRDGKLWPCDVPDGSDSPKASLPSQSSLPSNNHLVIYELPTSWAKVGKRDGQVDLDVGTFADVLALFDTKSPGAHFKDLSAVSDGAILQELGINALELLPAADTKITDEWGYATANYFSTDQNLGSASDLVLLVNTIHEQGTRLFTDVVMAFGHDPYAYIAWLDFHLRPDQERGNDDSWQSHTNKTQLRDGYGGSSWRYIQTVESSYDPETGATSDVHPSWAIHRLHLARWMSDFGVDGLRLDSVNNIGSWDFVRSYKERAWQLYKARSGGSSADPSKFLVIGEELSMPVSMVQQGVLNALWNEPWQGRLRSVIMGESANGDNFEWTVRKLADCTLDNLDGRFTDGAQAVNYITSHDIEGDRKERLYNYLKNCGVWDVEKRAKLAFALLLTSVGVPMIFAGEEFCDQMDRSVDMSKKQTDPVNYSRKNDGGWRQELFGYVANMVKFRTACPALGEDDSTFFHVDQSRGGKIMAWKRGTSDGGVVVVANFSEESTPGTEYVVPDWPDREKGEWREVSQGWREVPAEWVGREPLLQWEAKIYTRWRN
ncbi:1,4-alpha-glucan branching enzyme GlgB [Diplogelasinospora grovesii]|uniref:1,4-alpha-glucan branching enzyme GlgB n=1 Tax=Diplogelasinospora grovesii TaxID=303347 RepID=A0AAN6N575_9PEZI|nr:1,4-alpha-glucan branching enzyme GlgB [Diplogelasinospora grovesii]